MLIMTGVLSITGVSRVPEWMTGSIIAPLVSTIMLGVLLIVEFLDCRVRSHAGLENPERRKRDGAALKLAFVGLFLAWGLGVPTVKAIYQASHPAPEKLAMERMSFVEEAGFRCGEAMVTACFFALGANIGSFLNVVAWRMPLRKSIVHGETTSRSSVGWDLAANAVPAEPRFHHDIRSWKRLQARSFCCSTLLS